MASLGAHFTQRLAALDTTSVHGGGGGGPGQTASDPGGRRVTRVRAPVWRRTARVCLLRYCEFLIGSGLPPAALRSLRALTRTSTYEGPTRVTLSCARKPPAT